jgi:hypothetical protein
MAKPISKIVGGWRRFYGENPLHLLALLGCFALAGYAVSFAAAAPMPLLMLAWFISAVIAHDLVLYPLYALADRSLQGARRARRRSRDLHPKHVPATNYIRIPILGAGLLLLVFFPSISAQGEQAYTAASGLTMAPYLGRWLLITAAMFLLSALSYAARLSRTTITSTNPRSAERPAVQRSATPIPE